MNADAGSVPTALTSEGGAEDFVEPREAIILQVAQTGFVLASTAGDRIEVPTHDGELDFAALEQRLEERRRIQPDVPPVKLQPDDDITADALVATMDALRRRGFESLSFL